ncbi:outer membrane protein [Rhodopseudomonas rhenobacensis]|uniref:Outer membrane protein n=1 Tax=Rhodopseudomonas rhenobacensis TaxID=87461 RepID=A0A7W7Z8C1_9BRAD|nr:OmpW family protein [Rhodopseudomonas rhenobacensis]MBB5049753.1 outer membrane protein [Rhodopseudomonas rhenobacensis]
MKKLLVAMSALMMATALNGLSTTAEAADMPAGKPFYKAPAVEAWNPWMIRLRALGVVTRDSGYVDQVPGSGLATSDVVVPELDISYFFTRNIAAELILGVTKNHVTGTGALAGVDVGKSWLLPPTLTLQYHFTDFGAFKPYIGAGVNYTFFFSQSAGGGLVTDSHLKDAAAPVAQIGFDYMINNHWGFNVDVKKLWLRPEWNGTAGGLPVSGKVNLDPWLIGTGITYKF